jgi:hypothetical protein
LAAHGAPEETTLGCDEEPRPHSRRADRVAPIADVLAELLAQYQARFPEIKIDLTVVDSSSAAA